MAIVEYYGTGKRKSSTARVRLLPGEGQVIVNKRDLTEYFKNETQRTVVRYPLAVTDNLGKFDIRALVRGGGTSRPGGRDPSWDSQCALAVQRGTAAQVEAS